MTYPIQPGKIQAPALRDETLARTRLLDWLEVKIHRRVIFVIADAGYGKTTLLADFSRRTRLRTVWYRLDEDDRDWVGFLAHLVAAGRELDPGFAPRTASILRSLEAGGPTREDAIETFLEEMPSLAKDGAALILDDFHLADEVADIRAIAREIVARGPERLSIVFASRRPPAIPVAKLRTLGELAELGIADLRFSDSEMEQLFRETYGRPLEPDVLAELAKRTEGWAASLALVQAALRERTPAETRSFVRTLSGARDDLHDYLAEEVVGDLPAIQQQFLMRTSILQRVTPELAQVASGLSAVEVQSMIAEAERLGLLGRRAKRRSSEQRYHPLVREFLEYRLQREVGSDEVMRLHVSVAEWARSHDWQTAAHHFAVARRPVELATVFEDHLSTIVASGAFAAAAEHLPSLRVDVSSAAQVILSRVASVEGNTDQALTHAYRALELAPTSDVAALTVASSAVLAGDVVLARATASRLAAITEHRLAEIGEALTMMIDSTVAGDLRVGASRLEDLAKRNRENGESHFEGVSLLNASLMHKARGDATAALADAAAAIDALAASSSGAELASAKYAKAWALAWLGDITAARSLMRETGAEIRLANRAEFLYESSDLEACLGDVDAARTALEMLESIGATGSHREMAKLTALTIAIREHRSADALQIAASVDLDAPTGEPGRRSRAKALLGLAAVLADDPSARELARSAIDAAASQSADAIQDVALLSLAAADSRLAGAIVELPSGRRAVLSVVAELVVGKLDSLSPAAMEPVMAEASGRPERWRPALRFSIATAVHEPLRRAAAVMLDVIGDRSDIASLRKLARQTGFRGDRGLGRGLARRLAAPVQINDLGRVRIFVGGREAPAEAIRRKVLALLCFLLTRPGRSATREEAMDALWPDMDPSAATNSLNQTIYFLRRVFEPEYIEDQSPGYVRQESDMVILDPDLVTSSSARCVTLINSIDRSPNDAAIEQLSRAYADRFATDFAYDEWASDFREWLHVSYLQIMESAITTGIEAGRLAETLPLARRALEAEPRMESLALSLLKLLKGSGTHAAAAEQYERYASLLRSEIGVEPPPFEAA